jgi:hypothetical protein
VVLDDGAADRQPHPQTVRLGRIKRFKETLGIGLRQPRTRIAYRHESTVWFGIASADQQLALSLGDLTHRFNGVHDQIEDHLLQLNAEKSKLHPDQPEDS